MGPSAYSKYYSPTVLLLDKLTAIEDKRQGTYLTVNPTSLSKASIGSCSLGLAAVVVHHKYFNLPRTYKSTSLAFTCDIYIGSIIYIYVCDLLLISYTVFHLRPSTATIYSIQWIIINAARCSRPKLWMLTQRVWSFFLPCFLHIMICLDLIHVIKFTWTVVFPTYRSEQHRVGVHQNVRARRRHDL